MITALIKELFTVEELHNEYTDNNISYVIDVQKDKENNKLTIEISLEEGNKDKEEFENWVQKLDDDIFQEIWESLSDEYGLKDLNDIYESDNYQEVIDLFKSEAKKVAKEKVDMLTKLFEL